MVHLWQRPASGAESKTGKFDRAGKRLESSEVRTHQAAVAGRFSAAREFIGRAN